MKKLLLSCLFVLGASVAGQTYCTPAFSSGCVDDHIDDFEISQASFSHLATGCSTGAYADYYATHILTLQPTISYNFTVTHGYEYQSVRIWVDFNNDQVFDDLTELVGGAYSGTTLTSNGSLLIPVGTAAGDYRLRIATKYDYYNDTPPIPCNTSGYGEAHDYKLTVTAAPTCIAPTALTSSNISTDGATISWTAPSTAPGSGYQIYYSTSNTPPTPTTVASTTSSTNSVDLTSLTSGTDYYVWVRSACTGTDVSAWTPAFSFTTNCTVFMLPYNIDFENAAPPAMPICTLAENLGGGNSWIVVNDPGSGFTTNALTYYYSWLNDANAWFYTGGVNLTAGTSYRIAFSYGQNSTSYVEKLKVTYGTAQTAASQTNVIHDYTSITGNNTPQFAIHDFIPATTGVYYFGFNIYSDSNQYNFFIDDISVTVTPTCLNPTNITVSNTGPFNSEISWVAPASAPANGYTVYYSTVNAAPTASTVLDATNSADVAGTTASLTGLQSSTTYYFWVRSNCSSSEFSPWTPGGNFSTTSFCPVVTSPANNAVNVSVTPTITWDAMTGATGYRLTVGTTAGGNNVLDNFDVGNVTSYTFATPLANSTTYYYAVNSYNGTGTSSNCSVRVFMTVCAAVTPNYLNDFATFPGACWSVASGGDATTGPSGTSQYWYADGFLNAGSTGAAKINLYNTNRTGWLLSPIFDLTAGNYVLTFDYGLTNWNNTSAGTLGSDDIVQILMSTDGGTTWTVLETWNETTPVSNTSNTYTYNISSTSNTVQFAFYGTDGAIDDSADIEFFVDNFAISSSLSTSEVITDTKDVKVYPNPFTDIVNISDIKDIKNVTVIDMSGRVVKSIANPARQLNLGDLKAGIYILKLDYKDGTTKSVKAIKK